MTNPHVMAWRGLPGLSDFPGFGEREGLHLRRRLKMAAAHGDPRGGGRGGRGGRGGHGGPHGGRGGYGPPPWGGGGFGPGFPPGFGTGRGRGGHPHSGGGPRVQRGDVRAAVLALLAEQPRNGYQIIKEVAERSGGVWRPSAGSVYPVLQQLEDEGLTRAVASGSRRMFELTEEGREYVESHPDECAAPWESVRDTVGEDAIETRDLLGQLSLAATQVLQVGTSSQAAEMRRVLTDARRSLYQILARDDSDEGEEGKDDDASSQPS